MIKFDKIYKLYDEDYSNVDSLCKELDISPITAKVLINRGFNTAAEGKNFLNTDLDNLNDPFLLKGMNEAVERIIKAIDSREKICIYGDYDADGVTSTSILLLFLKKLNANCIYYLPNRLEEGYGLNFEAISYIKETGATLLITVDCGITNIEEVDFSNKLGIDVIVTDHHQCTDVLPRCISVINPNRCDSFYPFKKLAGVGVAFKLIEGLSKKLNISIDYEEILPIVAVGTVADVMPLVGENRIIVKNGLRLMREPTNLGLRALLEVSGLKDKEISSYHVGFVLGPRLNAGGRLGIASIGVQMFTSTDYEEALSLARKLDEENQERQKIEAEILKEIENLIEKEVDLEKEKVIVLASSKWHSGIIGICASKITDKYFKPSILFSIEGDMAKGSARSIPTFDIYNGLTECKDLFEKFGGHRQAAGIFIEADKIDEFRKRINNIAGEFLDDEDFIQEILIDCEVSSKDITLDTIEELKQLEPFGIDNPSPQFICRNAIVKNIRQVGRDNNHLKLLLEKDNKVIDGIGFNMGEYGNILDVNDYIDIVVSLDINDFMGNINPQFLIKEIVGIKCGTSSIKEDYYCAMKNCIRNDDIKVEKNEGNIDFLHFKNRLDYTMSTLKTKENILVLVFNYYNVLEILKAIQMEGRDILRKVSLNYNMDNYSKPNNIVFLPILSKIDYSNYKKVLIYDLNFNQNNLIRLLDKNNKDIEIERLFNKEDTELNKKILDNILPSIDEMRVIYKALFSVKGAVFRIESYTFLKSINKKLNKKITKPKLDLTLEIFKDLNFIDFVVKDYYYFVKVLGENNQKIDIMEVPKVKYLYSLNNFVV